ncbi:MAG: hypothetical protein IH600_00215 [Bacteroidetes bacterium]|nr:hypothetical protein [Bacteroidota bacterium]
MRNAAIIGCVLFFVMILVPRGAVGQVPNQIDVAVYMDEGAWEDGVIAFEHFLDWKGLTHLRVDAARINAGALAPQFRCLYMPGGYAYDYKRKITGRGETNIRDLVSTGGAYVGICAGAYFAADHVDWEGGSFPYTLGLFKGTARGALAEIKAWPDYALTTVSMNPDHPITRSQPRSLTTMYFGGPAFLPDPGFIVDTLATWDAAGNQPAMVAFPHGSGHVLLLGPHPEIEENDARDGTSFGFELTDPESEWSFLWGAMDWVLGNPVTDTVTTSVQGMLSAPKSVVLGAARPNPFSDHMSITIFASVPTRISVTVVDLFGRDVATLFEGEIQAGSRVCTFDASRSGAHLASGRYFIRLMDGRNVQFAPVIFLRPMP